MVSVQRILTCGHICMDLTPALPSAVPIDAGSLVEVGPMTIRAGGCVANTWRTLDALQMRTRISAVAGDDELARLLRDELGEAASGLLVSRRAGTSYSIVLEPSGEDRAFWHHTGANADFDGQAVDGSIVDIVHVGYPSLLPALLGADGRPLSQMLDRIRAEGATVSVDLAVVDSSVQASDRHWPTILRAIASHSDVISPSLDDLASALQLRPPYPTNLRSVLADELLYWGAAVVVISDGPNGLWLRTASAKRLRDGGRALALLADEWSDLAIHVGSVSIANVRSTNGAGDASTAGLLFGIASEFSPREALETATACSAATIQGSRPTPASISRLRPNLRNAFKRRSAAGC